MSGAHKTPTILVLAGKRDGVPGPLAEAAGVSHKAIMLVAGRPLIAHILSTLEAAWDDAKILVSIHDPSILDDIDEVIRLKAAGRFQTVEAQTGIVESLEEAARHTEWPLLITTADSALATVEGLHQINAAGQDRRADVVLGLAQREVIRAAHPDGQWGFYEFKDIAISNCNLFWMRDAGALKAAEAFRTGGQFFKNVDRIRKAFGLWNLIRFKLKMDTVYGAMERISRRLGVRVVAHLFDDGELAIDVDNERTFRVTEELLARRRGGG
ncbi:MAG: NTP transferase domain-containing protein [Sphingomonadaceae bacterium]|nr:NTP transferase domain-containing protein [Sphingomonadaceae bacterium]